VLNSGQWSMDDEVHGQPQRRVSRVACMPSANPLAFFPTDESCRRSYTQLSPPLLVAFLIFISYMR
jgi:hypothetical protein